MIDIDVWMRKFTEDLLKRFGERIWFVGLQGSYARGEATDQSDIDVVVIFDRLSSSDIRAYNEFLDELPSRNLVCGGRGMQKRNFDSELKSLNDKPSNQASICKATSSPKLNGVF